MIRYENVNRNRIRLINNNNRKIIQGTLSEKSD
jgi:hypothetical protein